MLNTVEFLKKDLPKKLSKKICPKYELQNRLTQMRQKHVEEKHIYVLKKNMVEIR